MRKEEHVTKTKHVTLILYRQFESGRKNSGRTPTKPKKNLNPSVKISVWNSDICANKVPEKERLVHSKNLILDIKKLHNILNKEKHIAPRD
jgi:hypothetical protein